MVRRIRKYEQFILIFAMSYNYKMYANPELYGYIINLLCKSLDSIADIPFNFENKSITSMYRI